VAEVRDPLSPISARRSGDSFAQLVALLVYFLVLFEHPGGKIILVH
jgi:hypothetical protein